MAEFDPGTGRRGILERPGVRVFQQFGALAPTLVRPLLEAVIIGECYQIVTEELAGLYTGSLTVYSYPGLIAGATVISAETTVILSTVEDAFDITTAAGVVISASSVTLPAALIPEKILIDHAQVNGITSGSLF